MFGIGPGSVGENDKPEQEREAVSFVVPSSVIWVFAYGFVLGLFGFWCLLFPHPDVRLFPFDFFRLGGVTCPTCFCHEIGCPMFSYDLNVVGGVLLVLAGVLFWRGDCEYKQFLREKVSMV